MNDTARDVLETHIVPIILGDGLCARLLCMKAFLKYGLRCIICDIRPSAWRHIIRVGGFCKISESAERGIVAEQLKLLFEASDGGFLVLVQGSGAKYIDGMEEELEQYFVLAKPSELFDKIYSEK